MGSVNDFSTPTAQDILRRFRAGDLATDIATHYPRAPDGGDDFFRRCITLHNDGQIDLLVVPFQAAFDKIEKRAFFTAQSFYCQVIPELRADAAPMMTCCQRLITQAENDLDANRPNPAFAQWCHNHPDQAARIVHDARQGLAPARDFVTFALQGLGDLQQAIAFVEGFDDDRRLFGIAALGRMEHPDDLHARQAVTVLARWLSREHDDLTRLNALSAAFECLQRYPDPDTTNRLLQLATEDPGPKTLHGLAQLLVRSRNGLDNNAIAKVLDALQAALEPGHHAILQLLDIGLESLLGTPNENRALSFLTEALRDGRISLDPFGMTVNTLNTGSPARVYALVVRWLLSGSVALGNHTGTLVRAGKERIFNENAVSLQLSDAQQGLLCRKAVGYLFLHPAACCAILISVARGASAAVRHQVGELLLDPLLQNYGGAPKDYLEKIGNEDPAFPVVQDVLTRQAAFLATLNNVGNVKELHPSERQRNTAHQRSHDQMRDAYEGREKTSLIRHLAHRAVILHGRRTLSYFVDPGGQQRAFKMDLKTYSASFELPRLEILDPVGLDILLRTLKAERVA